MSAPWIIYHMHQMQIQQKAYFSVHGQPVKKQPQAKPQHDIIDTHIITLSVDSFNVASRIIASGRMHNKMTSLNCSLYLLFHQLFTACAKQQFGISELCEWNESDAWHQEMH